MSTTIVKDSIVGDAWIQQTALACPIRRIINPTTGEFTGDVLTGPVRLAFDNLWELPKPTPQKPNPKFGVSALFTPYADFGIIYEEYYKVCQREFAEYYEATTQQYHGLHSPFHDQAEKIKFGGFTPRCTYLNVTSKYKPPIVDARMNPIVDRSKIYPGVWAILAINAYAYGKNPPQPKKGVGFGLQSVMIIGDDTKFGGGAPDARSQFAGVSISAPIVRPDMLNSMPMAGAPAPSVGIPGYIAPGGGVAPQAQPYQGQAMPAAPMAPAGEDDMSWLD